LLTRVQIKPVQLRAAQYDVVAGYSKPCPMKKMQPEDVVAILKKHGREVTIDEAAKILEFLRMLADIAVAQELRKNNETDQLNDMTKKKFDPQAERELLSWPGDTIKETLTERKISPETFAAMMAGNGFDVADLIAGREPITPEIAQELERALDIPAQFWINRETLYRKKLAEIEAAEKESKNNHGKD
jgi:plasmid maintenance system antidote protein VapI